MANWKTTVWGIATILVAVCNAVIALVDNSATTSVDIPTTIAMVTAGIGLIKAKDSSEK